MRDQPNCLGCGRRIPIRVVGHCGGCYNRLRLTPEYRQSRMLGIAPAERFITQVQPDDSGCWLWIGTIASTGYGQFTGVAAHRWAYEQFVGPIPKGMHIDHVRAKGCQHRHCVNWVDHLEVVTPQENVLRSPNTFASRWAARTHCDKGHEFTDANTLWRKRSDNPEKTYRACRSCARERATRSRLSRRIETAGSAR